MEDNKHQNVNEMKYPRHILLIGPPDAGVLSLLKELTGSAPSPREVTEAASTLASEASAADPLEGSTKLSEAPRTTTAGLSHELQLTTRYYRATIPIWIDETSDPTAWKTDFSSSEAAEVIKAVGAWLVVFRKTAAGWQTALHLMSAIKDAVATAYGGEDLWDGAFLCVGMRPDRDAAPKGESTMGTGYEQWDDESFDLGFEFIDGEITGEQGKTRNAAGELQGLSRLMEALEANDWDNVDDLNESTLGLDEEVPDLDDDQDETAGFRLERAQMEREFAGLKMAMADYERDPSTLEQDDENEEQQVEELERMMLKMHAVRDMSSHMSEPERKRLAKKTVDEMMKTM